MRDHNKAFCRLVAETIDCPGPVFEFGSYQVAGQEHYANLRSLFPGKDYVGCDMRPGPGVDRVEDVSAIRLPDGSAGTVLCIETTSEDSMRSGEFAGPSMKSSGS